MVSVISIAYWCFTSVAISRKFRVRGQTDVPGEHLPPATLFRPIKRGVPRLRDKVDRLIAAAKPGDQVLLAVECEEDAAVCEAARDASPADIRVEVIRCRPLSIPNPKIAKLMQLAPFAVHEHWILTDSEALLDKAFLLQFRTEWYTVDSAALTAGYRFIGASCLPEQLDHLPALLTLWPGLAITEMATAKSPAGLGLTLGACTGVRRADLLAIGGWEAFADYLAEDNRIGRMLGESGNPVRLARAILTLDSDPMRWRDWFLHQHRVSATYRVCNPAGFAGMIFTHGLTWAALAMLLSHFASWAVIVFAIAIATRIGTAWISGRALKFAGTWFAVVLTSFSETLFWVIAWLPIPVRWGPRKYLLRAEGRLRPIKP
jgi:ceramide glucosyltransferase